MAPTVGIVSPGAMGSALADALDTRVVATLEARSDRTRSLAGQAKRLELLPTLGRVLREADVVLSVVPPGEAAKIGAAIRDAGERFLFVDLNAVSPGTVVRMGADVDGAISGPPPWKADTTRIYLSGARACEVAELPWMRVELVVVGNEVGTASAVKMCTASVYKGTTALLAHALLTAHRTGVLEHVLDDLRGSFPEVVDGAGTAVARATTKSARYVPEMRQIAETQSGAGLPRELFEGVAAAYEALSKRELASTAPEDIPAGLGVADALDRLGS
jgi:3-hydroxyisobutyrate dehydrogenase-like beta-hydroxyacid dehydrogenase